MKLSHLSIAIFAAISLAACGGSSSSNDQTTPETKPQPEQPKPEQPKPTEDKIVDPTQTGVVGDLDLATEASVGTTQYLRGEKSKFDREFNPSEETSATSILGVTLNKQNPWLSNIALAQLKSADGEAELVQYLGNPGDDVATLDSSVALQNENRHNVVLPAKADWTALGNAGTDAIDDTTLTTQIGQVDAVIQAYNATANTGSLTTDQEQTLEKLEELKALLTNLKDRVVDEEFGKGLYVLKEDTNTYNWGDKDPTTQAALDDAKNGDGPKALGLVAVNYVKQGDNTKEAVQGEEADSKSSTRIFGRNYNHEGSLVDMNSWLGAEAILLGDQGVTYNAPGSNDAAGADASVQAAVTGKTAKPKYNLAAVPNKLYNVQYGRVTGNLNPGKLTKKQLKDGGRYYEKRNYLTKGNSSAVDTYFYRGTNATTIEQMAALPKGKELTYAGHALMYGLDNSFHGEIGDAVPNAFGSNNAHALGNFVLAKVDLDKEHVVGSIYNRWQEKGSPLAVADVLVTFDGNVFGNTVLGEAQRTYDLSDKADFRASFFGKTGEEMGGSINSTTWQERYGAKGDVWGGVFGATRIEQVNQLTNQWLGDIPALTPSK